MHGRQMAALSLKNNNKTRSALVSKLYNQRYLVLMLLPAVIVSLVFCYIPIAGWYTAFVDYKLGRNILGAEWVGLKNFKSFFMEGSDYLFIIRNTLVMNLASIVINIFAAVCFAILVKEIVWARLSKMVQLASFFPFFISWTTTYSIIYALFASSSGAINITLMKFGIIKEGIDLLGSPDNAWILIIGMNIWKYLGYNSIIFLASIAAIPTEQYEAAEIDGAGRWGKILHVTLPNLKATIVVLVILNSGWVLNSNFEQYYLFTNDVNWEKMEVFDIYIYKYGLGLGDYSYATAVGIVKTAVSITILLLVNGFSKKMTGNSIL